jgi:hypothetical protein
LEEGFNLRETEIAFSATVDPYFDANLLLAVSAEGDVELEEGYFTTRRLPAGLRVKGGKFLSDIGYLNSLHPHQWDFVDQPLPYRVLIGDEGLSDTGLQLTWLPRLPVYTLFGLEALQGRQALLGNVVDEEEAERLGLGSKESGPRLFTGFVKLAPDLGYSHALQAGLFGVLAHQHQELRGAEGVDEQALEGDAWLLGTDWVYKYDAGKAYGQGDFTLQAEYLYEVKDLEVAFDEAAPLAVGQDRRYSEDGFYIQGVYGIAPRWTAGLRYDSVGLLANELESGGDRLIDWPASDRWSLALTWYLSEFSRLRLQWARADLSIDGASETFDQLYLQFIHSLGSHGAHRF